ncbi:hypothetical protein ABFS82_03G099300 [Erythranthe guttata]
MAEAVTEVPEKVVARIGKQLAAYKTCPNKSIIVKLLKQAASAFGKLQQSKSLEVSVKPLSDSLVMHGLLDHKDKDVRHLVGRCLCEVLRVLAPNPDFSDAVSRDIFRFLLSMFGELVDTEHTYFSERAKMLETVAKLRFYLVMLDTGCEDLIFKMFKVFFSVVRENHPQSLINSMSSIIVSILEEKVEADSDPREKNTCQSLLDVIFQNIIKEKKDAAPDSFRLAESVIKHFGEKMEHSISQFLTSCILNRDAVDSVIKESYHEIIVEIYRIAPQLLLSVIPCLTHELLTDQVDVRIKALNLIRKLIASGPHLVLEYPNLFIELLNRFSDKSAEVRLAALSCAKTLYMTNPSGKESLKTLSAIQDRLLDNDDKVRIGAINVVCELSKINLNLTSSDLITQAAKRLRDKKVLVRRKALEKLIELYQEYCTRRAERNTLRRTEGNTLLNEHIEEIPCEVLMLCYEKDCQEFRPQSLDLVLADLFPFSLSIEEKISHWIFMFSLFKPPHLKALRTILSIKRRLRDGLNDYLDLWSISEDSCCVEAERKMEALVAKMASCFPDPAKAKDCFQKLKELKDNGVHSVLQQMLRKGTILDSEATKGVYFRELGDRKALSEFLLLLSKKCSLNIFGSEPVNYILNCLSGDKAEKKHLKNYQVQLLLTIISAFPSLLRGSEKQFQLLLLEREIFFNDQLVEMLAKEGYHLSIKLSDIYSSLEEICLEGTRRQAKLAVSAIATLASSSEQHIYSKLCKTLVDSLCNGENVPTVLQSLGCMAQHSVSTFEAQEKVIAHYIFEEIFQQNDVPASKDLDIFDEASNCCSSCKLKIFGLKALVRSFLPHKHTSLNRPISSLLGVILQMLQQCALSAGSITCENDDAFIRLAAARSVLRLSRKWDLHISPEIFRLTILVAKENSPDIRRSFAQKINKLLKNHAVPGRYACAFSFVALDPLEDLRSDALKYLEEFVREYSKGVQIQEITTMQGAANHPLYLVVFLIHVLAHDPNFPAPDCRDEKTYAQFLSPLFVTVQALVNEHLVQSDVTLNSNASLYLRSIFSAIKKAEDAIDDQMTPKLHLLAEVGICILNSLNTNNTGFPHAPGLILLPSSLYKIGPSKMREANAYPLIGSRADVKFTKKMISWLKTEVSVNGSTRTNIQPSGSRNNRSSSKSSNPDDFLMNKNKDQVVEASNCDFETRGRHNTFSAENKHERDPCRNLRSKPTFPCNSATTKPSLSQKNVTVSCSREEDTVNESGTNCTEPSKSSRAGDQVSYFTSKMIVIHETEEVDILSLDSEMCETDLDDLQAQRCDYGGGSSANDEDKLLDAQGFDSIQENLPRKRNKSVRKASSQAVKRSKRCEDAAIGSLTSEVIDT